MKKWILILALGIYSLSSCENGLEDGCIEVREVANVCGNAVLQVVGSVLPEGIANSWTDHNGNTYQNVFMTFLDGCDPNYPEEGDSFYVKIVDERMSSDCAVCLALLAGAPEEYFDVVISPECSVQTSNDLN